jgi:hypothetical protein
MNDSDVVDNYYSDAHDEEWFKDFRHLNSDNDPLIEDVLENKLGQDVIVTVTKIFDTI